MERGRAAARGEVTRRDGRRDRTASSDDSVELAVDRPARRRAHDDAQRPARVYYSNKTADTIAHKKELDNVPCDVMHHITAEQITPAGMRQGRIVLDECIKAGEDAFYMICGSVQFVRDMWQGLTRRGVLPENITTETFFES